MLSDDKLPDFIFNGNVSMTISFDSPGKSTFENIRRGAGLLQHLIYTQQIRMKDCAENWSVLINTQEKRKCF